MNRRKIVVRPNVSSALEELDRRFEGTLHKQETGVMEIRLIEAGIERQRPLEFGDRLIVLAVLVQHQAA
ncbi:hypothetical protein D9M68_481640 [compost metagenome]